jgi:hypothetical protein
VGLLAVLGEAVEQLLLGGEVIVVRAAVITGVSAKFWRTGGDSVCHSKPAEPQGLGGRLLARAQRLDEHPGEMRKPTPRTHEPVGRERVVGRELREVVVVAPGHAAGAHDELDEKVVLKPAKTKPQEIFARLSS